MNSISFFVSSIIFCESSWASEIFIWWFFFVTVVTCQARRVFFWADRQIPLGYFKRRLFVTLCLSKIQDWDDKTSQCSDSGNTKPGENDWFRSQSYQGVTIHDKLGSFLRLVAKSCLINRFLQCIELSKLLCCFYNSTHCMC